MTAPLPTLSAQLESLKEWLRAEYMDERCMPDREDTISKHQETVEAALRALGASSTTTDRDAMALICEATGCTRNKAMSLWRSLRALGAQSPQEDAMPTRAEALLQRWLDLYGARGEKEDIDRLEFDTGLYLSSLGGEAAPSAIAPTLDEVQKLVDGIEARHKARGFYVPEDIRDLADFARDQVRYSAALQASNRIIAGALAKATDALAAAPAASEQEPDAWAVRTKVADFDDWDSLWGSRQAANDHLNERIQVGIECGVPVESSSIVPMRIIASNTPRTEGGEHTWVPRQSSSVVKWEHCSACGIIRNRNGDNKPCKGPSPVVPR